MWVCVIERDREREVAFDMNMDTEGRVVTTWL